MAAVLPGGVQGEEAAVGLQIVPHQLQVAPGGVEILPLSGAEVEADHLFVVDRVVGAGGALRELARRVDIQALAQIDARLGGEILPAGERGALQQAGGDGPAVVRRVEAARADALAGAENDLVQRRQELLLPAQRRARGDLPGVRQRVDGEGGVRRGVEIAGGEIEAAARPPILLQRVERAERLLLQLLAPGVDALGMGERRQPGGDHKADEPGVRVTGRGNGNTAGLVPAPERILHTAFQLAKHHNLFHARSKSALAAPVFLMIVRL